MSRSSRLLEAIGAGILAITIVGVIVGLINVWLLFATEYGAGLWVRVAGVLVLLAASLLAIDQTDVGR